MDQSQLDGRVLCVKNSLPDRRKRPRREVTQYSTLAEPLRSITAGSTSSLTTLSIGMEADDGMNDKHGGGSDCDGNMTNEFEMSSSAESDGTSEGVKDTNVSLPAVSMTDTAHPV